MKSNFWIQTLKPHVLAILSFAIISGIYFAPQFSGKVLRQGDVMHYEGMAKESKDYYKRTGEHTLWTNSMFGGMPTYQINTMQPGNQLRWFVLASRLFLKGPFALFLASMICFYILMLTLKVDPLISAIAAFAFGFGTNNLILFEAGHDTQLKTITYLPLIASGVIMAYRSKYLLGALLFGLGLGLDIFVNHLQMTYYFFMTMLVFVIGHLIVSIQNKELQNFIKASAYLAVAGLLAIGTSTAHLWTTYEYADSTIRGKPILETVGDTNSGANVDSSSKVDGLDFGYATQWSNGTIDLMASFIAGVAGGSGAEPVDSDSATSRLFRRGGVSQNIAPLYWGELPFTSGPIYFGAISILLFLIGSTLIKGPLKWWVLGGVIFTMMVSLGKNFFLYRFLYDFFPMFNKFRTPNSILSITIALIPMLGFLSLAGILKEKFDKEKVLKSLYIGTGIYAAICLYFILLGPSMYDFESAGDARYAQIPGAAEAFQQDRISLMRGDSFRVLVMILIAAGLIWAFVKEKIKAPIVLAGIGLLTFVDLFQVGKRYLNDSNFVKPREYSSSLSPRPVDEQIMADPDLSYRVIDLSTNPFVSSTASLFHKSLGGYHAAKLQRYQDIVDYHIAKNNTDVLNMLNTRYIIGGQAGQEQAQRNPGALGNAWFVDTLQMVPNANAEIESLNNINPRTTASLHQEYADYVNGFDPNGQGSINLTVYEPNHLTYQTNSDSEQFAVFSEVWYGPNLGWQAYIDDQPVDHIRANYVLRGMRIPSGSHKIDFKFEPKSYYVGKNISLICSLILGLGLIGFLGMRFKNYYENWEPTPEEDKKPKVTPTKKKKTSKRKK